MTNTTNPRDIEEIRKRWADKSWPNIGYFAHGDAVMDIDALLLVVDDLNKSLIDMLENGDARSRQMARAALRKAGVTI